MSANETLNSPERFNETHNLFYFENNIPMPSYLIAMVVGNLEYRPLGERVGIATEPEGIEFAAEVFEDLPRALDLTEEYLTPYIWGNYTLLVLPPSFPYGGMENPLLTFVSPSIVTADKSQVWVAIHEIAHSWTGNQITC